MGCMSGRTRGLGAAQLPGILRKNNQVMERLERFVFVLGECIVA